MGVHVGEADGDHVRRLLCNDCDAHYETDETMTNECPECGLQDFEVCDDALPQLAIGDHVQDRDDDDEGGKDRRRGPPGECDDRTAEDGQRRVEAIVGATRSLLVEERVACSRVVEDPRVVPHLIEGGSREDDRRHEPQDHRHDRRERFRDEGGRSRRQGVHDDRRRAINEEVEQAETEDCFDRAVRRQKYCQSTVVPAGIYGLLTGGGSSILNVSPRLHDGSRMERRAP